MTSTSIVQLVRTSTLKWLDMGRGGIQVKKNNTFDDVELLEIILKNHLTFFIKN